MLIEPIKTTVAVTQCSGAACLVARDDISATRFAELMAAGEAQQPTSTHVARPSSISDVSPAIPSLGDAILSGLRQASGDVHASLNTVSKILDKPDPKVADLLRVQVDLLQASMQWDFVGKILSKSTQNFDSLVKLQ